MGLFVIPKSETVRLNGRKLQRDIDYMMIYEVGTLRLMNIQLDEYDEIEVEFERAPFGGSLQQTVARLSLEKKNQQKSKFSWLSKFGLFNMGTYKKRKKCISCS